MSARYLVGDVFDRLAELEDSSIDLVITSPPFLALRSYLPADHPDKAKEIGSEPTPAAFLDVMLKVMGELRRVTVAHGSVCIELGDTYAGSGGAGGDYAENGLRDGQPRWKQASGYDRKFGGSLEHRTGGAGGAGWPLAKSKALIPELFRVALAYGINPLTGQPSPAGKWLVRNVVTWCRPNPPVGALGDKWRPATSDVVVACTSPKRYWDDLATRGSKPEAPHGGWPISEKYIAAGLDSGSRQTRTHTAGAPLLDYWEIPLLEGEEPRQYGPKEKPKAKGTNWNSKDGPNESRNDNGAGNFRPSEATELAGAPLLDYWEIPPTGYSGSHYAVYPPALVEPLVKAMCPEKVCKTCGEPRRRIVGEASYVNSKTGKPVTTLHFREGEHIDGQGNTVDSSGLGDRAATRQVETVGWTDCGHDNWRPGLILDPFAGSGTTLLVATGHGHDAIGIDLDERNADLALERVGPFLLEVEA